LKGSELKYVQSSISPDSTARIKVDACGLQCPGPIMQVYNAIKDMNCGDMLEVAASDPAFARDVDAWCTRTGNELVDKKFEGSTVKVSIRKGTVIDAVKNTASSGNDKTMVVFSGDLDKAIASFIIANGSAAMGRKVTMFFTFWGLNILRKPEKVNVRKSFLEKMVGTMMPRGAGKLNLSKMNMGGMGGKMIKYIMNKKNVSSLQDLIAQARAQGIHLVACSMSMDIMGIKQEELIDGVEIGGVASYLASAETADTNLFI
jgi:peroxiredoxin family protein/TusA-related sulfurtransferase